MNPAKKSIEKMLSQVNQELRRKDELLRINNTLTNPSQLNSGVLK